MKRRDLLIGAACLASAGVAYAAKPRKNVNLLGSAMLTDIVPLKIGPWYGLEVGDPLALNQKDSLAAKLYNQLVTRSYRNEETGEQVFMLLAYGARQSDELQLHRPEICYPAFGYTLTRNEPMNIALDARMDIPARRLQAEAPERRESIIYWSRLGDYLPQDGGQQREARFETALAGIIPDGLLSRLSAGGDPEYAWRSIERFVLAMFSVLPKEHLDVFIGQTRAKALLAGAGSLTRGAPTG